MKIKKFAMRLIFLSTLIQMVQLFNTGSVALAAAPIFNVSVNGLTLTITPTIPNRTYTQIGIKLNSSAYNLAYVGSECTLNSNGYCLFAANSSTPKNITISGSAGSLPLTICLNGKGPISCQQYTVTVAPAMSFSGIRTDLTVTEAVQGGFTECYNDLYSGSLGSTASTLRSQCTGNVLLVTCRPVGATTFTLAAMALNTEVFYSVPATTGASHDSNGTQWYYSNDYSMGFAPVGATLNRSSCDVYTASENNNRLCFHTSWTGGGYRCGSTRALNGSNTWLRTVYQRNGSL